MLYAAKVPAILAPVAAVIGAPATAIPAPTALANIIGTIVVAPAPTLNAAQSRNAFNFFSSFNAASIDVIRKSYVSGSSPGL